MKRVFVGVIIAIVVWNALSSPVWAQSAKSSPASKKIDTLFDCADVSIQFESDPTLTPSENLARMDAALLESLSKFDSCQQAKTFNKDANTQSGGTAGGMAGTAEGGSETQGKEDGSGAETAHSKGAVGQFESVASSDMSGEEKATWTASQDAESAAVPGAENVGRAGDDQEQAPPGTSGQTLTTTGNGKLPEDIPSADNDSVLEAQIRQAAINEKDPVIKAKLWNEYRKYKGLPLKNKSEE